MKKENKIDFTIRRETPADYAEIYELIQTAFKTAQVSDGDEQDYAENLRKGPAYIPELALVAEKEGKLIGHIMLTKAGVNQPDKTKFEALLVAPLSVVLEYRNMGIGSALMQHALIQANKLGYTAVFLCGNPIYYNRFGFKETIDCGIKAQHIPDQFSLVYEIIPGALKDVNGILDCF